MTDVRNTQTTQDTQATPNAEATTPSAETTTTNAETATPNAETTQNAPATSSTPDHADKAGPLDDLIA